MPRTINCHIWGPSPLNEYLENESGQCLARLHRRRSDMSLFLRRKINKQYKHVVLVKNCAFPQPEGYTGPAR
jgi:hypothetical protein